MTIGVKDKTTCPRCGKPALSDHGVPYCLTHGTISEPPTSNPLPPYVHQSRKKQEKPGQNPSPGGAGVPAGPKFPESPDPVRLPVPAAGAGENKGPVSPESPGPADPPVPAAAGQLPASPPAADPGAAAMAPITPPPSKRHPKSMNQYYETNKELIIRDYQSMGWKAAARWRINGSQFRKLLNRWNIKLIKSRVKYQDHVEHKKEETPPATVKVPVYPNFSDTWQPEVQIKWLEIYEKLRMIIPVN